jgi:tRNA G18 (ribose-2'-O)-methylase SpoU
MRTSSEVVSSVKHPAVEAARRSLGQLGREPATAFLADGHSLVAQALASSLVVEKLFFLHPVTGEEEALLARARLAQRECLVASKGVFFRILALGYETSVRVLAVVHRPQPPDAAELVGGGGCVLVGEDIQDPRNVGVLIRTADAWGLPCTIFSQQSADPYCRASVRSSTGSVFRVPVVQAAHLPTYLERLRDRGLRIIGTSAQAPQRCWDTDLTGPCALVLGNESVGISEEVRAVCGEVVSIPLRGGAHSFNVTVAAGILLYERDRQAQRRG